jgi:hypothetical protein
MTRFLLPLCFWIHSVALAADDTPQWLRHAASIQPPKYEAKVGAVVLLDEEEVRVEEGGRVTTTSRYAVRVLNRDGRRSAIGEKTYLTGTSKVRDFRAWLITPAGDARKYGKEKVADVALSQDFILYDEGRARIVDASNDTDPGAVFGYEAVVEAKSIVTQFEFAFQGRLPALESRFTLVLPVGWKAQSAMFNAENLKPQISGANESTYTWEMRNLPFLDREPASPNINALAPRLAVSFVPAEGAKTGQGKVFANWSDVSRWQSELADQQAVPSQELAQKAQSLVGGAQNDFDRIRAIGRYVQGLKYVAIETGIGKGGGYKPHAAADVFRKSYGDCKDKANLMRTMLKSVGIESYLVAIYSGDRNYVREEWPSPHQFNHMIIAVKVSADVRAGAVLENSGLGRLLIFDPTDSETPVGYLPENEQASLALVISADHGALLRMPVTPAAANHMVRETRVALAADGSITSQVEERSLGETAAQARRLFRRSRPEYVKVIERWVSNEASGAAVSKIEPGDGASDAEFRLRVDFTAPRYGRTMQGRLMMFRPAVLPGRESLTLTDHTRKYPIVLNSESVEDTVHVKLPPGFKIDELPGNADLSAPFGHYEAVFRVDGDELLFTRRWEILATTIPATEYSRVREFFEKFWAAEQAPVVLVKQ